jgi:release factor glutamine methyltransferase
MTPPETIGPLETIGTTVGRVVAALAEAGFDEVRRRARRLVAAALGMSAAEILAHSDRMITAADADRLGDLLRRTLAHEPLSRILGMRAFWGLEFALSPETLDPRPETETLVEAVLARLPDRDRAYRFLDLGTGSGCLLLALLSEFPGARGLGVDRAFGAASTARRNAQRLGFGARACFAVGDWASALTGQFDVIVANPPYIESAEIARLPREVRDFDPRLALDGGADGLGAYRAIMADASRVLRAGGLFVCEIGAGQDAAVAGIVSGRGFVIEDIVPDLAGIARCVVARRP